MAGIVVRAHRRGKAIVKAYFKGEPKKFSLDMRMKLAKRAGDRGRKIRAARDRALAMRRFQKLSVYKGI